MLIKDEDYITIHNNKEVQDAPLTKKTKRWVYIIPLVIFTCATLIVLAFFGWEAVRQATRSLESGPEQYAQESLFNIECKQLLDKLRDDNIGIDEAVNQLETMNNKYAKSLARGVKAFGELKKEKLKR